MNKCKYCSCSDANACKGGCFWVDENKTICSSCAIDKKLIFVNHNTEKRVILTQQNFGYTELSNQVFKYMQQVKIEFFSYPSIDRVIPVVEFISLSRFLSDYKLLEIKLGV